MRCSKCNVHCIETPLFRTNSIGESAIWMCEPCIKKQEPELHKNIQEDESTNIINIINNGKTRN